MLTYWCGSSLSRAVATGLLILPWVASPALGGTADGIHVAQVLARQAQSSQEAGEILRSYLLYSEAAKRDPDNAAYRDERNRLAPIAELLRKKGLETANIKQDIANAERAPIKVAAAKLAFSELLPVRLLPAKVTMVRVAAPLLQIEPEFLTPPFEMAVVVPNAPPPLTEKTKPPLPAADPVVGKIESRSDPWRFAFKTQILGYSTYSSIRHNSVFNPDNKLADLATEDFHLAARPDLKLSNSIFSFSAKPRADYEHSLNFASHNAAFYLQEWSMRIQATPALTFSYGRELPMWGPSMSVPASNPWFRDNGRNTPLIEIGARDFGRVVWQPSSRFAISYIANTALRRGTPDFLPFRPSGAVKADYIGNSLLASGIYSAGISSPFGQRKFVGGYIQKTLGQAFRFYVEGSAQQGNPGYFPTDSAFGGLGYSQTKLSNALAPRTIVGGFAYTDTKAGTWTAEYIYNPFGYASMMADAFYSTAQNLSATYLQGGVNAQLAAEELARTSDPGIGPLRRHYAFAQYQRNGLEGRFDVVLRYTLDVKDSSGQAVAYLTWNTSDTFQIIAVFAGLNGSVDTEFARYLHYQAQLGFRFFLH